MPEVGIMMLKSTLLQITIELPGHTSAYCIAEVRLQISGIILKRNFMEGSDIQTGVSLYQIDSATYQANYDSAKGDLAKAQAAASMDQLMVKCYQELLSTKYISQQDYDTAVATAQQSSMTVVAAKAATETARINLVCTKVISSISSRIGKPVVTEGALVQNSQMIALATIQQLDLIHVDATQSSSDFLRLKQELTDGRLKQENGKAKAELVTNDGLKYPQASTLEFSDVTVDQTTGSITLRATFLNLDHTLLPGMFVYARLEEGVNPDALLVSQQGVARTPRGDASIMVVGEGDKIEVHQVTASQAVGDKRLAANGLKTGDCIIATGPQKVELGVQVKAQEVASDDRQQVTGSTPSRQAKS